MSISITGLSAVDLRFPTSRTSDGTDAMHRGPGLLGGLRDPEDGRGLDGPRLHLHHRPRQRGRASQAIRALRTLVVGRTLAEITADPAAFWRSLASDSQLRWLGPEKGVIHLALAAIVNAVWDLRAKVERASRCGSCWPT